MNVKELQSLSAPELQKNLGELKEELRNLRFQHAINQLENPGRLRDVKRDIARVMTMLRGKELSAVK